MKVHMPTRRKLTYIDLSTLSLEAQKKSWMLLLMNLLAPCKRSSLGKLGIMQCCILNGVLHVTDSDALAQFIIKNCPCRVTNTKP